MKYDDLDFVIVWSSIKEVADITANRPGHNVTSESLNEFANRVLKAFPKDFVHRMKILESDIKKKYEGADNAPSDTL